jgi:hypothetical protein
MATDNAQLFQAQLKAQTHQVTQKDAEAQSLSKEQKVYVDFMLDTLSTTQPSNDEGMVLVNDQNMEAINSQRIEKAEAIYEATGVSHPVEIYSKRKKTDLKWATSLFN